MFSKAYDRRLLLIVGFLMVSCFLLLDTSLAQAPGSRIQSAFENLDGDKDGMLTEAEFDRDSKVFSAVDADSNQKVSIDEVRQYLRSGGRLGAKQVPKADPTETFGTFTGEMPVTLKSCREATEYSRKGTGHAVLVMHDGKVLFQSYTNGWSVDQPHRLASGTKSFAGVAAAVAVQEGLLSLDERVSETIKEWNETPGKRAVTIRQLLSLTSGLDPGDNQVVLPYEQAIGARMKHAPGVKFEYGPNPFQIFGELMKRKLKSQEEDYLSFLGTRVFDPIGMKVGSWRRTNQGDPHVPSGAFITAGNWARFGELLRLKGSWEGKEIFSASMSDELTMPTKANPRYGVTFWLGTREGSGAGSGRAAETTTPSVSRKDLPNLFMAAGAGKQRLYVIRNLQLVVVRFGETEGRRFQDQVFLDKLLVR